MFGIESFIFCMEMSVLMGMNVVRLIVDDLLVEIDEEWVVVNKEEVVMGEEKFDEFWWFMGEIFFFCLLYYLGCIIGLVLFCLFCFESFVYFVECCFFYVSEFVWEFGFIGVLNDMCFVLMGKIKLLFF